MRTILFTTVLAITACATNAGEQADVGGTGKADAASRPSGTYKNPAPHAGELGTLTLGSDHTFSRTEIIECAVPTIDCEPLVHTGTYRFTRSSDEHFIHFYSDDGSSLDRYQWDLADGHLELASDGSSRWFEMDAAASPKICGGFRGALCGDGEYCDYGTGSCGAADRAGVCKPIPSACTEEYAPVCGCDGQTYGNACEANAAGSSTLHDGGC